MYCYQQKRQNERDEKTKETLNTIIPKSHLTEQM